MEKIIGEQLKKKTKHADGKLWSKNEDILLAPFIL